MPTKFFPGPRIARLLAVFALMTPAVHGQGFTGVLTQHNDIARTGQNLEETVLTTTTVNPTSFGKVFSFPVDGQIYAQPLYMPNVTIPNHGVHNVLYVATENDTLYAFDADNNKPNILWSKHFTNPAKNIITINCIATGSSCNVYPNVGITSTPVIDPTTNTIYLVVRTEESNVSVQRLHALDITTGAEKFRGPVEIAAAVAGTGMGNVKGTLTFDPLHDMQRAALLLLNGSIYIGWAGEAHGWVMAYNAATLAQQAVLNTTPNGSLGGVWQAGGGLVADSEGNIYFTTGDGTFDANSGGTDYGDTIVTVNASLNVLDYFTPMDQACRLIPNDLDLASGGPMILPPQAGSFADELIHAGKGGSPCDLFGSNYAVPIYLIDRDNMGKYNPSGDQDIQTIAGTAHGYWSSPAYWQSPTSQYIYYSGMTSETGNGDYLKQYSLTNGVVSSGPVYQTTNLFPVGSTPSISANGTSNGILWAVERKDILSARPGTQPAVLYAFSAEDVSIQLYNSTHAAQLRDQPGCANKFITPTIANGRVYLATQNELDVYGIFPVTQTTPVATISVPCFTINGQTVGKASNPVNTILSNLGPGTLNISSISVTGTNSSEYSQTNTCGKSLAAEASCTISITFTPTLVNNPQVAPVMISDNAAGGGQTVSLVGVASKE
jgi:hypothetical protein